MGTAQTAKIEPAELVRIPAGDIGDGVYWQQLVIEFQRNDAPSDSTVSVVLPQGVVVADTDLDEDFSDEVRVVYAAVGVETPDFFVSPFSESGRIVVGSLQAAAAGGEIYLQFPIKVIPFPELEEHTFSGEYGQILFDDPNSLSIAPGEGPRLTFVEVAQFDALASMDVVPLGTPLVGILDTATTALGTWYPELPEALALRLPDLVFDSGVGTASNLLPGKDGDNGNDVAYRFFLSPDPGLQAVDSQTAFEVLVGEDSVYRESERLDEGLAVRMLLRDVPTGLYFLYVVADVTGRIPLARSRGIFLRHQPQFSQLALVEGAITLDSGEFFNPQGEITGEGLQRTQIEFAVVDHDDTTTVQLFYSEDAQLVLEDVEFQNGAVTALNKASPIGVGLRSLGEIFTWDILEPEVVPAGNYYIYAVASDGADFDLRRSQNQVRVQHSPLLRLDVLDDRVRTGVTTIATGGLRPQRFVTLTWGRNGFNGDEDIDDNARISLYYSEKPATLDEDCDCYTVLSGADELLAEVDENAFLIAENIFEDPDLRRENLHAWDMWDLADSGKRIPQDGTLYYIYGIIQDNNARRLVQMHGRSLNDAGSRVVFAPAPPLLPLQPVADIGLGPGVKGRVAWEDMDLDDDARIRILLSEEDHQAPTNYAAVAAGTAYVVNSANGSAKAATDSLFDLSEDSPIDHFDISVDHIETTVDSSGAFGDGDYFIYLAITQSDSFDAASAVWRAPGRVLVRNMAEEDGGGERIRLLPEILSIGTGGVVQQFDLVIDAGDESVDQVSVRLTLETSAFAVVDQDDQTEGIQPFFAGEEFSDTKIFINEAEIAEDEDETVYSGFVHINLAFDYFDPTAVQIANLDGRHILASMELITQEEAGVSKIELEVDEDNNRVSRLLHDGQPVFTPEERDLVEINQVAGKAILNGRLALEGRNDIDDAVIDFSLRHWGSYTELQDGPFVVANDDDPERPGVQVELEEDGSFTLEQVPTGRLDLYAHLDGYLDAWVPGLELYDGLELNEVRPTSTGDAADSLMLGGDVAGYTELDGQTSPDNEVTLADWDFVSAFFAPIPGAGTGPGGQGEEQNERADITGDGDVGILDLALVGANFRDDGPRPVYKAAVREIGQAQLQVDLNAETVLAGREVEFEVKGAALAGVRAYEMDLAYDPRQWSLVDIKSQGEEVLALQRHREGGVRLATTQVGRGRDFSGESVLVKGRLRALGDHPAPPILQSVVLLDQQHRRVDVRVLDKSSSLPQAFELGQNYPNPFNPQTAIPFAVPFLAGLQVPLVQLEIYNVLGQQVRVLWDAPLAPGQYRMVWDGLDGSGFAVGSGVYLYRMRVGDRHSVKRMILLR